MKNQPTVKTVLKDQTPIHRDKKVTKEELEAMKGPKDFTLKQVPHVRRVGTREVTTYSTARDYSKRAKMRKENPPQRQPTMMDVMKAINSINERLSVLESK